MDARGVRSVHIPLRDLHERGPDLLDVQNGMALQ